MIGAFSRTCAAAFRNFFARRKNKILQTLKKGNLVKSLTQWGLYSWFNILIQTLPIVLVIKSRYKATAKLVNDISSRVFKISCDHTVRLIYQHRDGLANENSNSLLNWLPVPFKEFFHWKSYWIMIKLYLHFKAPNLMSTPLIDCLKRYHQEL